MTEVIAAGLSLLLVTPVLLLVPVLTDLWYWAGWSVTPAALVEWMQVQFLAEGSQRSIDAAAEVAAYSDVDITQVVAWASPSLLAGIDPAEIYAFSAKPQFVPGAAWQVVALAFLMTVLMSGLFALVAVPLADTVMKRPRTWGERGRAITTAWYQFLGLVGMTLVVLLAVMAPVVLIWVVMAMLGIDLTIMAVPALVLILLVVLILLSFSPEAIVAGELGVIKAMKSSRDVVKAFLLPALALVTASLLITIGLGKVWLSLAQSAPGLIIAVGANAFFACGLAMASMIFYAERTAALRNGMATKGARKRRSIL